jgi:hypothetical protein
MDFGKKVKDALATGAAKTRDLYSKARSGAKGLSEQAVLALEISQLGKDVEKKTAELGAAVFAQLSTAAKTSVSRSTPAVKSAVAAIEKLQAVAADKKAQLAAMKRGAAARK